ncbi:hypothetical protein [Fimbriiglobus ruber]|uniref:Uncharacterized protein n=1 Tax=Fimbriiglobus ruber TaxID=1908690 RepID=A0A225DCD2_9BACT|nr:hypothetical protein [Fimbriiglobus ruber]OWK34956.1 hypothetical protein FRUB_09798 [Fimbriiglobus ruber]
MAKKRHREWEKVSVMRLHAIAVDTEADCPAGNYTAAEVYDICRELQAARAALAKMQGLTAGALDYFARAQGLLNKAEESGLAVSGVSGLTYWAPAVSKPKSTKKTSKGA